MRDERGKFFVLKAYLKRKTNCQNRESKKEKKIITKRKITWDNIINNMKGNK